MRHTFLTVALLVLVALPAAAQQPLKISFEGGRVSIDATSVPVRAILTEWGKAGGTKIVGAERISGAPLTVKLVNVTEAQALETILRSVAGYMAAPRNALGGPSMYDRILVMATTSAPAPAAAAGRPANNNPNAFAGTQRFVPPPRQQRPEPQEQDEPVEADENPPNPPVFTFPQPGQNGFNPPGSFVNNPAGNEQPTTVVNPAIGGQPGVVVNPAQPGFRPGSATPGMIIQPPPTQTNVRPPGRY
jgi:hypothetical protein